MFSRVPAPLTNLVAPTSAVLPISAAGAARRHPVKLQRQATSGAEVTTEGEIDKSRINEIPKSRWPDGVPPVMGGHLMGSGEVAPISTTKEAGGEGGVAHKFFYPSNDADVGVVQYSSTAGASAALTKLVAAAAKKAIKARGAFTIALTGGSLLKILGALAGSKDVDWSKWHVFFGDERNVPHSSPDSTIKGAREGFLSKVPIPEEQIHAIVEGLSVEAAATEYAGQMLSLPTDVLPRTQDGEWPVLDLVLLGVGPDGHICSLFPNRPQTSATAGWVVPISDSPKPPPERITFTLPVLNAAKEVVFVALGEGKAEIVQRVLEVQGLPGALPAQMVRPTAGTVTWLLDADSAAGIAPERWSDDPKAYPRSNLSTKKPSGLKGEAE